MAASRYSNKAVPGGRHAAQDKRGREFLLAPQAHVLRPLGRKPPEPTLLDQPMCLLTSLVISNMLTTDLPLNSFFSFSSALIKRLLTLSCRPCFLM